MPEYAELAQTLAARQKQIVEIWTERTLRSYKSSDFFLASRDPFANPVGMRIRSGLEELFTLLCKEAALQTFARPLDQIVRIRAVQEFAPSQAVVPFLELKWVVRETLGDAVMPGGVLARQFGAFDCAVERMALLAFDLYCQCREQLYQGRIKELKSGRARFADAGCPSRRLHNADVSRDGAKKEDG